MFNRLIDRSEEFFKGVLFGCRGCGQCVLRKNFMICPMQCPKGLRNGPCGGTLDGKCEVHPERACVHVRINTRRHGDRLERQPIMPAVDAGLMRRASLMNAATGRDAGCRTPLAPLVTNPDATTAPLHTVSALEATLKAGRFAFTTEVRSPRGVKLDRLAKEAAVLRGHFDAVNATAYLAGNPSLPSTMVAAELQRLGIEAIAQCTGRDFNRTVFVGELFAQHAAGVRNLLCLTGDWRAAGAGPQVRQVFELDGSLMLYEARHLRDRSRIHFTGEEVAGAPRPFLGAAINPFSDPIEVPVRRLAQKADAGADFIQTQVVTDVARLARFMELAGRMGTTRRLFTLAGIPVVTGAKAFAHLGKVAGVKVEPGFAQRMATSTDLRRDGVAEAIRMVRAAAAIPGIHGVHLMLFGPDAQALVDVRQACADLAPATLAVA
jgi:methylenetetrahydrofolate reductase (NADPH)